MESVLELTFWTPKKLPGAKPAYLEIADAIAEDIRSGKLRPTDRLPPQRTLAGHLGLNFATVARAYTEARQRGLIDSRVGDGTFIRVTNITAPIPAQLDLTMNLPPQPEDPVVMERMRQGLSDLAMQGNLESLLHYQEFGGSTADREAGAKWLGQWMPEPPASQVLVCPGAQSALLGLMSGLARPGNVICCEDVTYSGTKALAAQLGIRLQGLASDEDGLDPDAFADACRQAPPKALYCNPVMMNPTTSTLSLERRHAIVAIARQYDVPIIEDDAYGMLPVEKLPQLAALAPELTYYVSGLAKCVGAGLRVAYLSLPSERHVRRIRGIFRATMVMASPLMVSLATRWVGNGTAALALAAIRKESMARQALAKSILPAGSYLSKPEAFHLWLKLTEGWSRAGFAAQLAAHGLVVVVSDAFTVSGLPPEAVRVCLGGVTTMQQTQEALEIIADTLEQSPAIAFR